jgi:hypothetical protein
MKATHYGHCQICGARQLLPGSVLAKHGYTTKWGFFSGTCTGSGHQPFEVATNLIEDAIARAQATSFNLRAEAITLRATSTGTKTWVTVYDSATWKDRSSRTRWVEVELTEQQRATTGWDGEPVTISSFHYTVEARQMNGTMLAKAQTLDTYGATKTLADAVAYGNKGRAAYLDGQADQYDSYAKWQAARIAKWAPAPLVAR